MNAILFRNSLVIASLAWIALVLPVSAATFTVTNANDSGPGSLRQAILDANGAASDDVINFDATVFGSPQTITLSSGELLVEGNGALIINGTGAAALTISANNASRVLFITPVATPTLVDLTLNDLTITGGNANGGGGIRLLTNAAGSTHQATLTLNRLAITNNITNSGGNGGGLSAPNKGCTVNINDSVIANNTGNNGGGVHVHEGGLNIINTTLQGNAAQSGAAIYVSGTGSAMAVSNSSFIGNMSAGASGGSASAIRIVLGGHSIRNSTFANNAGDGPTITNQQATLLLDSVTLAYNTNSHTGATQTAGVLSTFSSSNVLQLRNTILANNTIPSGGSDVYVDSGSFESLGYNLLKNIHPSSLPMTGDTTGNLIGVDPILESAPRHHGGPTKTLALLEGSPAIDAGETALTQDQRGLLRPVDLAGSPNAGNASDMGGI